MFDSDVIIELQRIHYTSILNIMLGTLAESFKFKVIDGTSLGKACVAKSAILEGEIICKFAGPFLNLKQFFEKYEADCCNVLQIGEDTYIDVIEPYLYFNHSCSPNAGIRNNGILFALKPIKKGEEINFDYSTTVDDVIWRMDCRCNSKNCRKVIGDFMSIPHEQKEEYKNRGAIAKYLMELYY